MLAEKFSTSQVFTGLVSHDEACQHSLTIHSRCARCNCSTFHSVGAGNRNNNSKASGRCQVCQNHKFIGHKEFDTAISQIIGGAL